MAAESQRQARTEAQARVDRIAAFRAELAELERRDVLALTDVQRARVESHLAGVLAELARQFHVEVTESGKRISWGMRIATFLGSVAVATGVVLLLHRVWGGLPLAVQSAWLLGLPLALLLAAALADRRGAASFYTGLLALAASAGFVAGLASLGVTLNAAPSPHAMLAWSAFALLLAYAFDQRLLLAGGLVLLTAYTAALGAMASGGDWASAFDRQGFFLPAAAAFYLLPAGKRMRAGFDAIFRAVGAGVGLAALLGLSLHSDPCCSPLPPRALETLYQLLGIALGAAVAGHGLRLGYASLVNLGATGFVAFAFVRLHAWWWDWMPRYLFFLALGAIAFLMGLVFLRMRRRLAERRTA